MSNKWFGHVDANHLEVATRGAIRKLCREAAVWLDELDAMTGVAWLIANVFEAKVVVDDPAQTALSTAAEIWNASVDQEGEDTEKIDLRMVCHDKCDSLIYSVIALVGSRVDPPSDEALAVAVDRALTSDHAATFFWLGYQHPEMAARLDHLWSQVVRVGLDKQRSTWRAVVALKIHEAASAAIEGDGFAKLDALDLEATWRQYPGIDPDKVKDPELIQAVEAAHRCLLAERVFEALPAEDDGQDQVLERLRVRRAAADKRVADLIQHREDLARWAAIFPDIAKLARQYRPRTGRDFFDDLRKTVFQFFEVQDESPDGSSDPF